MQNYANNQGKENPTVEATQQLDHNLNLYIELELVWAQLQPLQEWQART